VFLYYEDYLDQLELYMQRTWTCAYTGRKRLTFEEALECEHTVEYLAGQFPERFVCEALLHVHRSGLTLDHLVMKLYRHFEPLTKEIFGDKPVEAQKEILRSFILVHITSLPAKGRLVAVKHESLKKYNLTQPVTNVQTTHSSVKTEGAFSLANSQFLGNSRPHPLALMSRSSNDDMEGIVAMDTGPPTTAEDPDPFPDVTGDLLFIWRNLSRNSDLLKCSELSFSVLYKSLLKSSTAASIDYIASICMALLGVIFQDIPRDIILQSKRLPHYFRKVNEQNWEEKIGTFLVAQDKMAGKIPQQFCVVPDHLLGDCCRETGEDWSLADLNTQSKISLLKFLVNLSLKSDEFMSPSNNGTSTINMSSSVKRRKISSTGTMTKNEEDPVVSKVEEPKGSFEYSVYTLGVDRCRSKYFFVPTMPERLFVRSKVSNKWSFYSHISQVDQLMCYLDPRNHGESQLKENIQKCLKQIKSAMQTSKEKEEATMTSNALRRSCRSKSEV
jgi:hypothetical protein